MTPFALSQGIALLALACAVLTFQLKKREHVIIFFALMSGLLSLHFYVLAQYTAMAVVGVSTLRFITSIITRHVFFMYLFLVITLCVGYVTYEAWYNLLAILAGLLGVIATFQPTDKRLREIMFSSSGTMAMHDFIVGTPVGLSVDLVALVSNSIGYYRYYIQKDST